MSGETERPENGERGANWLVTAASLAVGAAFLGLWFWLLPPWLGFQVDLEGAARWRSVAAVPSVLGFAVALRCIWHFGWAGHGTPVPLAPPQKLVMVGFYRYVRNPMYLGFFLGWAGLWVIFGRGKHGRNHWGVHGGAGRGLVCAAI
jgi:protein-S-isoprenylcysteine O-methyltransferase Ste14